MSRVTSKLQVTIPKRIAEQFSIKPGDDIEFVASADGLRVTTAVRPDGSAWPSACACSTRPPSAS